MKIKRERKIAFGRRFNPKTLKKLKADAREYGVNDTVYLELLINGKIHPKESDGKQ